MAGNARQTDSYVIAVMNQKGGVGKTLVTLSLAAHTVAAYGRALVVDVDPQANAHDLTRAMQDPGYEVVHELDPAQLTGSASCATSTRAWSTAQARSRDAPAAERCRQPRTPTPKTVRRMIADMRSILDAIEQDTL